METKRQSFMARVAMTLLLTVLTTVTAWAAEWPEYVTDIIVVGGSESEVNSAKSYNSGYTWCSMDLNKGAGGDYIYFGYKKSRTANTNGGYITDIIVIDAEGTNPPSTVTYDGRTYYLCSYDGGSHFEGVKGNLNSNCGSGWNIYLYYTKQEYSSTKRAVSSIDVNSTKAGSINCYYKSGSKEEEQIDLNRGISGSSDVYMHLSTATKVNRPYPEPSMASNLVYDGQPKQLISSSYSNSNSGTLYYRVGTTGSYTSTVANVTATAAGTHTVNYYSASSSYGNSSENYAHSNTVNIAKSANSGATVVCADGLESDGPSPSVTGNLSGGAITYMYATSQSGSYSATAPSTEGTYWVKATIAADGNCNAYTTPAVSFKLKPDWAVHNSGTTEADAYVISTPEDLNLLASRVNAGNNYKNKFFKLGGNITYDGTENNFTPIGVYGAPFAGIFDGNGKTISGLNINLGSNKYVGLFGYADNNATIKNLKLTNSTISGNSNVGAILGCGSSSYPNHTNVENCEVASDVNVSGSASAVGGITGAVANVRGCVSAASVSGFSYIGGIVGNSNGITISQCLYTGTSISSGEIYKGAITGKLDETTTILIANYYTADLDCKAVTNSNDIDGARKAIDINAADGVTITPTGDATVYNVSGITAYASNSGIRYNGQLYAGATEQVRLTVGYTAPADFVFNGYTDGHDNALTANDDDTYTLTMTAEAATVTPDGVSLWGIASGADGSQAHPYVITTPAGLDLLASNVNGGNGYQKTYFVLGNDIVYDVDALTLDLDNDGNNDSNYMPVGNGSSFYGNFDGHGHTISGIRVNANGMNYIGVFGINDGTVKNLTVSDCLFAGNAYVSAIAGVNRGTVENCHVVAGVSVIGNFGVGGVVGGNEGFVLGCTSAAALSAKESADYFGGIAGYNTRSLTDNLFTGTIDEMPDGSSRIGAITGYHNTEYGGTLTNNFHTCSGMGGVGNLNDATNTDQDGAQFAYEFPTANGAMGNTGSTYGTGDYTGITAYENGLYYNGKYYYFSLWGGSGTAEDPYIIVNTQGMDLLATNVNGDNYYINTYFVLGNDIAYDANALTLDLDGDGNNDSNYMPVGKDASPFMGNFDGQGHTIKGIRVNANGMNYIGVFGINDGTVKNLMVSDCLFAGSETIGAIAGLNRGTVENCHVAAYVGVTGNNRVGGIAGDNEGSVLGCTSAATLSANKETARNFGGIAGRNTGTLTDNLFTGTIDKMPNSSWYIGAITGYNDTEYGGTLTNNFHTCSGMGGVGNDNDATNTDQAGAQFAVPLSTQPDASIIGEEKKTYGGTEYTGITAYENGLYYNGNYYYFSLWGGSGTEEDPYVIYNTAGMDKLANDVNGGNDYQDTYFVLGNDIVYAPDVLTLDLDGDGNNDSNYMPVGNDVSSFYGNFDGQGHTISGISVNANGMYYIGVFGINDGTVKNLTVSDCLFAGDGYVGAIAGVNRGTVENCHVVAGVSITGNNTVGGVVGNNGGSVLGCTSAAALSAKEYAGYFGGIAGYNSGTLTDNLFTGTIDKMPDGSWGIGAITGVNDTDYGTLTNNFHTCSGMGGVGNDNDATNTDQAGAQTAVARSTQPDASIIGEEKKTYGGTEYTGITAYQHGLYYNGNYYISLWGGSGTEADPYVIYNTAGMDKLANDVNGGKYYQDTYFVLGNDIAYVADALTLNLDNDGENDSNYMPVGNDASPFCGNFDGQGHTISGISVNANGVYLIGVFGINDGTVKNLTVSGCLFAGDGSVGAIAGMNRGTVENCHLLDDVSVTGNNGVGGVVGDNEDSVLGCTSAATLSAKEYARYFGGIAGGNRGTLTDNLFMGTIDKMPDGSSRIGAITGYHNTEYGGTLTNNFHICSGMGGVGNMDDATNTDQDGAQIAVARSTQPDASIIGEEKKTYGGTEYTGITAYENGLYYNGNYYYRHEDVFMTIDLTGDATASAPITLWGLIERTMYGVYVDYDNYTIDLNLDGEGDLQLVPDMDNGVIRISKLTGAANLTTNSLFELIEDGSSPYNGLVIMINNSYQTEKVRPIFGIYDSGKDGMDYYNSSNISGNVGKQFDVMLKDRTFKKDGKWQTIVLPFDVDLTDPNSPLYGITYRTVTAANIENGTTLNLTFAENSNGDENTLLAGKPYIIKWDKAADYQGNESQYDITDPVFPNVTIQYVGGDFWNDTYNFTVAFLGTYNGWTNLASYFADVSESGLNKPMDVVLLGGDNKLHYAASDASLGACRAIFLVDPAAVTTADPAAHLTNYVMNLGNGEKLMGTFGDVMPGDANGDGVVTISDAVAIVNYILGKAPAGFNEAAADMNGDGKVTITDAVRVVNMIAAQQ